MCLWSSISDLIVLNTPLFEAVLNDYLNVQVWLCIPITLTRNSILGFPEERGETMKKALLIIDLQNDYFPEGNYPLWNSEKTLSNVEKAIAIAKEKDIPIIHIQHIAHSEKGISPFFNKGTKGVEIHPRILAAAPDAPIVIKEFADGFLKTDLEGILSGLGVTELIICGMMTQNCVTHTAISKAAEKYKVTVLSDCCTTVDEMIHLIALNGVSTRVSLLDFEKAL